MRYYPLYWTRAGVLRHGESTYAMPEAPKTPNLMALLLFGRMGGLKQPQRRPIMDMLEFVFGGG
jgi:hypothetical protein